MAFDCNSNYRKPLLFSDLFKNHRNTAMEKERHDAVTVSASSSSPSSSSTQFLSSWDSPSSSGFSTPLRSDFGSSEGDDADFIAELTRQMAECMLEEEDNVVTESDCEASSHGNSGAVSSIKSELFSNADRVDDPTLPNIHVYELKNQPPVSKESSTRGRRVRRSESAQQKTEQQFQQYRGGMEWGGAVGRNGYSGSGMQAVFIGGSGSRSGTNGTGVFLPRHPTEQKNKSGCSMVLMPTRVLQVLEQHFNRVHKDSYAPPLCGGSPKDGDESTTSNVPGAAAPVGSLESEIQSIPTDEMQLPQEWTY